MEADRARERERERSHPQETITEGEWMSEEQLADAFKSEAHAQNYIRSATQQGLSKKDKMRNCQVFFYMKKLERLGKRKEVGLTEA
eukprot:6096394-Alexandrium_andersonii.AAC.1